ncbi:MAG: IS630 family transposase, partial [Terrimicrobiaceae bacterium]|nr:IS630 family transposase [Terrimicrobiaceae bacterium]
MPASIPIIVSEPQRKQLEGIAGAATSSQRAVFRARIILGLAQGSSAKAVAEKWGTSLASVSKWRGRWSRMGFAGLEDAPGRGRKPRISARAKGQALSLAPTRAPHGGVWSVRAMSRATGLSKSSVQRLWSAHAIAPHRTRGFKLSKDLAFEEKFWDVVGLYLNPPDRALVLCCDEKSQCQALERSQPGLPLRQGHIRTQTHDYYRHGTVTLFAALDYLSGKVFAHTAPRHRHQEWLAFLRKIDAEVQSDLDIHIICDNYSTHKHAKIRAWLKRHPRFHLHFIPTSSS